jgi:hypothetical protein
MKQAAAKLKILFERRIYPDTGFKRIYWRLPHNSESRTFTPKKLVIPLRIASSAGQQEQRRSQAMHKRIQFISHQKKQILLVDFSNCSAVEVEKIARAAPDTVTAQPRGSVLLLADFTGALFNEEALRAMKESAVFDKPYIKKSAWVGAENLSSVFEQNLKAFSKREFPTFKTRLDALSWLVDD